jgi:hypothetical protein
MAITASPPVVSVGLGGLYRRELINRQEVAVCLPLHETYSEVARDLSSNENHGTYVGSGFTPGIALGLPEGGLGRRFSGADYVEVPADPEDQDPALSLQDGGLTLSALIRPTTIDATLRAIAQKQVTNSSGNGWQLAIENGAIRFRLRVGGSDIINFTRGTLSADTWYLVIAMYTSVGPEARIYINGVQSGATVTTGGGAELDYETADMRVGMFTDGAGGFIGDIAYVMANREFNTSFPAVLQATRSWTVLGDVQNSPGIHIRQGIHGAGITDLVASPGSMTFDLDNTHGGQAVGYYTPGHSSQLGGWQEGIPVKVEQAFGATTYTLFTGRIDHLDVKAERGGMTKVSVTATDYMDILGKALMPSAEAMTDVASDDVIRRIIDLCDVSPHALTIGSGSETFPFALDVGTNTTLLTELQRVCLSERGYLYLKSDGTLVYEGRSQRQTDITFDTTWVNTLSDIEIERSRDSVVNQLRVTVYPRRVDTLPTTLLYQLPVDATVQTIPPGESLRMSVEYSDPTQQGRPVGGIDVQNPVSGTDYVFEDASGVDRSAEVSFSFIDDPGGARATVEFTNGASATVRMTVFQLIGRAVYRSASFPIDLLNSDSVDEWGPRPATLDMVLQGDANLGLAVGTHILASRATPKTLARSATIFGNGSSGLMVDALSRQIGDRIGLTEAVSGIAATNGMHIQGIERFVGHSDVVRAEFGLSHPASDELPVLWLLGSTGYSELGETTYLGL